MSDYNFKELQEATKALQSTLKKCEAIDINKLGKSQQTLLKRRMRALEIALDLIDKESSDYEKECNKNG